VYLCVCLTSVVVRYVWMGHVCGWLVDMFVSVCVSNCRLSGMCAWVMCVCVMVLLVCCHVCVGHECGWLVDMFVCVCESNFGLSGTCAWVVCAS